MDRPESLRKGKAMSETAPQSSVADKILALEVALIAASTRYKILGIQLSKHSDTVITEDESLSTAKAEFDRLPEKIKALQLEIKQLQICGKIEEVMNMAKAFMPVAKFAIEGYKGEITEIIHELIKTSIDVYEGLDDQLARLSEITARSRFRQFEQYHDAGFSKEHAFTLVLASIKSVNFTEVIKDAQRAVASAATQSKR